MDSNVRPFILEFQSPDFPTTVRINKALLYIYILYLYLYIYLYFIFTLYIYIYIYIYKVRVKCSRYRPGVAQRVGRGITLLFHDRGTGRE